MKPMKVNGKNIGELKGGVLIKKGKQVKRFKKYDGYAIPEGLLQDETVKYIRVIDEVGIYEASIGLFKNKGIRYHRKPYESQLVLPRKYWVDPRQVRMF